MGIGLDGGLFGMSAISDARQDVPSEDVKMTRLKREA